MTIPKSTDHLSLHLTRAPRRYHIGECCGDVFEPDDIFDGFALTIELLDPAEADAIQRALQRAFPHWRTAEVIHDA